MGISVTVENPVHVPFKVRVSSPVLKHLRLVFTMFVEGSQVFAIGRKIKCIL